VALTTAALAALGAGLPGLYSLLAALAYGAAGFPLVYTEARSLLWQEGILREARGLCRNGVLVEFESPHAAVYCVEIGDLIESYCVNASYAMVGVFEGRPGDPGIRGGLPRDYTCFRPLRGRFSRVDESTFTYEGSLAIPTSPRGGITGSGRAAIAVSVERGARLGELIPRLRGLLRG